MEAVGNDLDPYLFYKLPQIPDVNWQTRIRDSYRVHPSVISLNSGHHVIKVQTEFSPQPAQQMLHTYVGLLLFFYIYFETIPGNEGGDWLSLNNL